MKREWNIAGPQLDKHMTKNKRIMLSKQQANSSAISQNKVCILFWYMNDSLMQKHSRV